MEERSFTESIKFRLFSDELERITKVITHAKDHNKERKYFNRSHLIRCAIIKLIREEEKKLKIRRGRPQEKKS